MYADHETDSMKRAISTTRAAARAAAGTQPQARHHAQDHQQGIQDLTGTAQDDFVDLGKLALPKKGKRTLARDELPGVIAQLKNEMMDLAEKLEFEKAAAIRDRILQLEQLQLDIA